MAHPNTIDKMFSVLKLLQKKLEHPIHISLSQTFRSCKMPSEYSMFLLKEGIISRLDGGTRGSASYSWNKEYIASKELSERLINRYTELRKKQTLDRNGGVSKPTNEKHLLEIKNMLKKIIKSLNIK